MSQIEEAAKDGRQNSLPDRKIKIVLVSSSRLSVPSMRTAVVRIGRE